MIPSLRTVVLCLVTVAVVGCGFGDVFTASPSSESVVTESPGSPLPSRLGFQVASHALVGGIATFDASSTEDVLMSKEVVPGGTPTTQTLDTIYGAEGLQIGVSSSGVTSCVVTTIDDTTNTSHLVLFQDTNADSIPDQLSRSTIHSEPSSQLCRCSIALDGTLYVIDGLGRIIRYKDTNGDLIPDGPGATFFTMASLGAEEFSPVDLEGATANSVVVSGSTAAQDYIGRDQVIHLTDSNRDGIAEVVSDDEDVNPATVILGQIVEGETSIDVFSDRTGSFQLRSSLDGSVLVSFGTSEEEQSLTSSRMFQRDERVQLWDTVANEMLDSIIVLPSDRVLVWRLELASPMKDGGSFVVKGRNLMASLSVELRLANGTGNTWAACTVTQVQAETLIVNVPTLGLTQVTEYVIRVKDRAGKVYYRKRNRIWP